jgi:peptidoglycan hydrolase-like amidase
MFTGNHPTDIKKNTICEAYNTMLKNHDNFSQMRIAMSRPNNLKDVLCRTNLSDLSGRNASNILSNMRNVNQRESNIMDRADDEEPPSIRNDDIHQPSYNSSQRSAELL